AYLIEASIDMGRTERAREAIDELLRRHPDRSQSWEIAAWAALHLGDVALVERSRREVARVHASSERKRNVSFEHELEAYLHAFDGRWAQVRDALEEALAGPSQSCTVVSLYAQALVHTGELERARAI